MPDAPGDLFAGTVLGIGPGGCFVEPVTFGVLTATRHQGPVRPGDPRRPLGKERADGGQFFGTACRVTRLKRPDSIRAVR